MGPDDESDHAGKLLSVSAELCAARNYEAAFHVFMALLHIAEHRRDIGLLDRVSRIAAEQGDAIDAIEPAHRLSGRAAIHRGQTPLYRTLQTYAHALRARIRP